MLKIYYGKIWKVVTRLICVKDKIKIQNPKSRQESKCQQCSNTEIQSCKSKNAELRITECRDDNLHEHFINVWNKFM